MTIEEHTERFLDILKRMQEVAKNIEPAPKEIVDKVVLPERKERDATPSSKKEDNCLF